MSVRVTKLSFSYPGRTLFKNLTVDFSPGGLTLIRGPSGCGKSTFLKLIAGLMPLESGEVSLTTVQGIAIEPRQIAYVHQDCHLIDHWTIAENFSLVSKDPHRQIAAMKNFDLSLPLNQKIQLLSGGEKQRISLIRMFLQEPELVLLDEPTAHLDDEHTEAAIKLIKKQLRQKTVLVVSHDQRLAQYADHLFDWKKEVRS